MTYVVYEKEFTVELAHVAIDVIKWYSTLSLSICIMHTLPKHNTIIIVLTLDSTILVEEVCCYFKP
jgi:hypothetical protein